MNRTLPDPASVALELADAAPFLIEITPLEALQLVSQLQLAGRHPENTGAAAAYAAHFVAQIEAVMPPLAQRVIAAGRDPAYDV